MQHRCTVSVERTIGSEIVLDSPNGPPSDVGHVESRFFPFGDSVSVTAIQVQGLHKTYHRHRNRFGCTRWYHSVARLKWKFILVLSEVVLILTQDSCMDCIKRTIGLDIVLDAPDGTHR
jgi:uncharacterized membrane protein